MFPSLPQIIIVVIVVLVLFGHKKIPQVLEDLGRGLRSFKKGLSGDDEVKPAAKDNSAEVKTDSKDDKKDS